jgi:hypothetical protein
LKGNDLTELDALLKEHKALMKDLRTLIKKNKNIPFEELINVFVELIDKLYVLNKLDTKLTEYLFQFVKK